jgi:ABC-type phosphate/phosphonate transport system substrate-binding protein
MHEFTGKLALVATPSYAVPGCEGPNYRSFLIIRADDPRSSVAEFAGAVAAINSEDSHSGFNILRWRIAQEGRGAFFTHVERTGSHVASLAAVQSGGADLVAIDCVTFTLLERHRPSAITGLRILEETPLAPALPFITATSTTDRELRLLREAIADTVADPALSDIRNALLLCGVEEIPLARYEAIRKFSREGAGVTLAQSNPAAPRPDPQ